MAKFSFKEKIKEEVKFDDGIRGKKIVLYKPNRDKPVIKLPLE